MAKKKFERMFPEGVVPFVDIEGTAREAGVQLGYAWREALMVEAKDWPAGHKPWWLEKRYDKLIAEYAPHLPDLFRGMAKGAGMPEDRISHPVEPDQKCGCTSFAIHPDQTLDGIPISGQTKDTGPNRWFQFQVLRLKLTNAPSMLTLTYQGWPFGHGFVKGGCAIWRNSLYVADGEGKLPYSVWGLLATYCETVEDVQRLTRDWGVYRSGHCAVADEHGGIIGIEFGKKGPGLLNPVGGIYVHANAVRSKKMMNQKEGGENFGRENSLHREARLNERFKPDKGRLTAQLAMYAMTDHVGYPMSVCRHEGTKAMTTSAVVVEPTRGLMHVTRGNPCSNWPVTYRL